MVLGVNRDGSPLRGGCQGGSFFQSLRDYGRLGLSCLDEGGVQVTAHLVKSPAKPVVI